MDKKLPSDKTKENKIKQNKNQESVFTAQEAIKEFEELRKMALNCFDKNGNPNINAALKAIENKAKIAGLYSNNKTEINTVVKMNEITIDGEQLKLDIGENFYQ